ncbi:uncharacterized protein LOC118414785 [Branchiostoma floridae]|uniref:Uncharacterized protein LOC118414785 n=1 Tax=Branchiostoma floridae TaxID=7739 RepID=C3Y427_BRAFL|nr:uncharacterized protein LOC118414785 [Branchiostoma floridae]|eukprot:XP_002609043.1 hypothetical protein BRAFLDRAFT_124024 [Branchiostoma floridae]
MRTTILMSFFCLIGFSCASMLAFILYLTTYGKGTGVGSIEWNALDDSIIVRRRAGIAGRNPVVTLPNTVVLSDRKYLNIKVADSQWNRPHIASSADVMTNKQPSVKPVIAWRENSQSLRPGETVKMENNSAVQTQDRHKESVISGKREQKSNETGMIQKLHQGNHLPLADVKKNLHTTSKSILRTEFSPVGQGQSRHFVLQSSSSSNKEPNTPKVESLKELPIVGDRTGLVIPGQKETHSIKDVYINQQDHSGLNSTSKYKHRQHDGKTDKNLDDGGKFNERFSALNDSGYTRNNFSVNVAKRKRSPLPVIEDGIEIGNDSYRQTTGDMCAPKKHFVWIKVHKAGSQTTNPIFERFAYKHHLRLLFGISNGPTVYWPRSPKGGVYMQTRKGGLFDALYVHSRYNKTWMRAHFPNDTVYLAIVKDPFSHFKSSFHYYGLQRNLNLDDSWNPVKTFLSNPWKYKTEALYQGIRFDKTRNAQLFDLGFPIERSHDMVWAREYIEQLDKDFLLVIILEHYAESLVLMKRLMCWELLDILLVEDRLNSRHYRYKYYRPTQEELIRYKQYAEAEYAMYEQFNKSLWTKISQQSQDFFQEVEHYKRMTKQVRYFCKDNSTKELFISASPWNAQYKMSQSTCTYLKMRDDEWRAHSWAQLRYPSRIKRPLRLEYYNNISKFHDKLLAAARKDSAEKGRS